MHVQFSNQIPGKHPEYVLRSTEPSIEWEDPLPPQNLRLENMRSRSLHTFVPLPPSSASPTLVTHGGIPSHMVENPEPNLRPTTLRPPTHMERDHPSTNPVGIHSPVLMSDPNPNPGNPSIPLHLDVKYLGTQSQFQLVPNKGSRPPLTHNQRRDKKCPTLQTPQCQGQTTLPLLARFQLPQKLSSMPSILMTLTAMVHQQRLLFTILKPIMPIVTKLHLTLPFLLVILQSR